MLLVHGDPTNEELQQHGSNQEVQRASRMSGWEAWRESSRASLVCYKDLLHYGSLEIRKSRQGMLMVALVFAPMLYPMVF